MSDQSSEKEFVCFTCLSLFSNAELVRVNGAEYCHTCAVEVLLDENERLREGWLSAECWNRDERIGCMSMSVCTSGRYCQAVRDVVEEKR